jgi:hypothetical protein
MKLKRLRAQALSELKTAFAVVVLGLSAIYPAGAQDLQPTLVELIEPVTVNGIDCRYRLDALPSASAKEEFSPWREMHPHTFDGKLSSYVAQCKATTGKPSWLTSRVCEEFGTALAQGNCAVVPDVNDIRLDVVRGKQNGKSMAFLNEHMQLGEPRQAVFVSLPGNLWLGMFAGEPGKSCNNFFALRDELPPPQVKEVTKPQSSPGEWVCGNVPVGQVVHSSVGQHLDGFVLPSSCGNDTYVPSLNTNLNDTVDSGSGYSERCFWVPNQTGEVQ